MTVIPEIIAGKEAIMAIYTDFLKPTLAVGGKNVKIFSI
jgi:hypothetical protein